MSEEELRQEIGALRQRLAEVEHRLLQIEERRRPHLLNRARAEVLPAGGTGLKAEAQNPAEIDRHGRWERLLGLQGFSWLGILALLSGLALFIRYAYLEGWLGPLATLLTGGVLALVMLLGGEGLSRKEAYRTWAHALMGGGVALLYFLVYAAYHFSYFRKVTHLTPLSDALLLMGVVGLAIVLALRRRSQSLASRAFVLGFVTSLFSQDFVHLTLVYNFLLSLGLLIVAFRTRWAGLALMGALGSWILHGIWFSANAEQAPLAQGFALLYVFLYTALAEALNTKSLTAGALNIHAASSPIGDKPFGDKLWRQALAPVNLLGFVFLTLMAWQRLEPVLLLGSLLLYLLGHVLVLLGLLSFERKAGSLELFGPDGRELGRDPARELGRNSGAVWLYALQASWGLGAVYFCLEQYFDSWLAGALCGLGLVFFALARQLSGQLSRQSSGQMVALPAVYDALGALALLRCCFVALDEPWLNLSLLFLFGLFLAGAVRYAHWRHLALGTEALLILNALLRDYPTVYAAVPQQNGGEAGFGILTLHLLTCLSLFVGPLLLRQQLSSRFQAFLLWPALVLVALWLQEMAVDAWLSVIWASLGAVLVLLGFGLRHALLRYLGLALLVVTGIKVYFRDLADLNLAYRIVSLLVLGVLLLGVALLYTRFQAKIQELPAEKAD